MEAIPSSHMTGLTESTPPLDPAASAHARHSEEPINESVATLGASKIVLQGRLFDEIEIEWTALAMG